jgi:signal transduction histidine kinase
MGGDIILESEVGKGTTFIATLPLVTETENAE